MGWDAHSTLKSKYFKHASKAIKKKTGAVDGYLSHGSLDCTDCRNAIQEATKISAYDDLSPDQVKDISKTANWSLCSGEEWAIESAKSFIDICAKIGAGIKFSY